MRTEQNNTYSGTIKKVNGVTGVFYDRESIELKDNEVDVMQLIEYHRIERASQETKQRWDLL